MRPPMFHLRFARSFQRFAAKTPYCTPSLRLPKRCTMHGRRRRTATNPKRLRNVMRGLSPPRCASPPSHCGYAFVRPSAERRPPMSHLRYARPFQRYAAKTPYRTPSPRAPKRRT